METLKQVLMCRDGLTSQEANEAIQEAREALHQYLEKGDMKGAENICEEYFGLEPDYFLDVLF